MGAVGGLLSVAFACKRVPLRNFRLPWRFASNRRESAPFKAGAKSRNDIRPAEQ